MTRSAPAALVPATTSAGRRAPRDAHASEHASSADGRMHQPGAAGSDLPGGAANDADWLTRIPSAEATGSALSSALRLRSGRGEPVEPRERARAPATTGGELLAARPAAATRLASHLTAGRRADTFVAACGIGRRQFPRDHDSGLRAEPWVPRRPSRSEHAASRAGNRRARAPVSPAPRVAVDSARVAQAGHREPETGAPR